MALLLAAASVFEELLPADRRASEELLPAVSPLPRARGDPTRATSGDSRSARGPAPSRVCASVSRRRGASPARSAIAGRDRLDARSDGGSGARSGAGRVWTAPRRGARRASSSSRSTSAGERARPLGLAPARGSAAEAASRRGGSAARRAARGSLRRRRRAAPPRLAGPRAGAGRVRAPRGRGRSGPSSEPIYSPPERRGGEAWRCVGRRPPPYRPGAARSRGTWTRSRGSSRSPFSSRGSGSSSRASSPSPSATPACSCASQAGPPPLVGGYLFAVSLYDEFHINKIATDSRVRQRGYGRMLLEDALARARSVRAIGGDSRGPRLQRSRPASSTAPTAFARPTGAGATTRTARTLSR